ncbi:hypothetical protein R3P38DRAFT_3342831 [Favolaschia claudopus]|uniref:Uncharacterized protein n=1 Tax=Favolaschia claudopus TaxID=2862362 RepID=A0AAW0DW90_9AGAR
MAMVQEKEGNSDREGEGRRREDGERKRERGGRRRRGPEKIRREAAGMNMNRRGVGRTRRRVSGRRRGGARGATGIAIVTTTTQTVKTGTGAIETATATIETNGGEAEATTETRPPSPLTLPTNSPTKSEFDVITGQDAVRFARKFVREQASNSNLALALPPGVANSTRSTSLPNIAAADPQALDKKLKRTMPPVVFALPRSAAGNTGRRVVDLYLSWRGKTKPVELTGRSRRKGFLDNEFQKVKEVLDGEWRRASRAIKGAVCAPDGSGNVDDHGHGGPSAVALGDSRPHRPPTPSSSSTPARPNGERRAPAPQKRRREQPHRPARRALRLRPLPRRNNQSYPLPSSFPINTERPPMGAHRGSVDSLTSVTSLPLLGMVRGVPLGNRGGGEVKGVGGGGGGGGGRESGMWSARMRAELEDAGMVGLHVTNFSPNDRMSMSMWFRCRSTSQDAINQELSSARRRGVRCPSVGPPSPRNACQHNACVPIQLPGRTASESSASSEGSNRSHKSRSSRMSKAARPKDEDKILIVLLDENETKDKSPRGGRERKLALPVADDGEATWHGLERRLSTRSGSQAFASNILAPVALAWALVNLDDDVTYLHTPPHSDDSDSDEEEEEEEDRPRPGPGAIAMGYLAPEAAVMGGTPSPYGSYTNLSAGYTSPLPHHALASYTSPYVSPQVQGSPYRSLPPSRPRTPVAYSTTSPTGQPLPPLYLTPGTGTVYPPTAYTSPTAAYPAMSPAMAPGYVSPYAAASPLGGIHRILARHTQALYDIRNSAPTAPQIWTQCEYSRHGLVARLEWASDRMIVLEVELLKFAAGSRDERGKHINRAGMSRPEVAFRGLKVLERRNDTCGEVPRGRTAQTWGCAVDDEGLQLWKLDFGLRTRFVVRLRIWIPSSGNNDERYSWVNCDHGNCMLEGETLESVTSRSRGASEKAMEFIERKSRSRDRRRSKGIVPLKISSGGDSRICSEKYSQRSRWDITAS